MYRLATEPFQCVITYRGRDTRAIATIQPVKLPPHVALDAPTRYDMHPACVLEFSLFDDETGFPVEAEGYRGEEARRAILEAWREWGRVSV